MRPIRFDFSFTYCVLSCEIPLSLGMLRGLHQGKRERRIKSKVSLTDRSDLKSLCLWWLLSFLANCSVRWAAVLRIKITWWWLYCVLNWSSSFPFWMVCYQRTYAKCVCRLLVSQHQVVSGCELSACEWRCCSVSDTQIIRDWLCSRIQLGQKFSLPSSGVC